METNFFWISPERMRGSRSINACTSCGAPLFKTKGDSLEFHGTHPRAVLCMDCKDAQDARTSSLSVSLSPKGLLHSISRSDAIRPTSIAVTMLASVTLMFFLTVLVGIRFVDLAAQSAPFDRIQDLVLVYVPNNQGQINSKYLSPYVSYLDGNGLSMEWLFDSFLFLAISSDPSMSWTFWEHTTVGDWRWWINKIFEKGSQVDALNTEIERVKKVLGRPSRRGVILSVPYPSPTVDDFGMRSEDGSPLNFVASTGRENRSAAHRLEASLWFVDEVIARWESRSYNNLELLGFYWFQEELLEGDFELVNGVADHLHERGYKLYWIPYNSEKNIEAAEAYDRGELRFDYLWLQPNYAFRDRATSPWKELRDLDGIARVVNELNASIEIEVDEHLFLSGDIAALNNFYHYLDGGLTYLYMNKPLAYYVFPNEMYRSRNSLVRQSYDALSEFVKDRHQPVSYVIHSSMDEGSDPTSPIQFEDRRDWGPAESVVGSVARLAVPGATLSVNGLDPFKDMILAVRYLTFRPGEIHAGFGKENEPLGKLLADGDWHTGHWSIDLSSRARKDFDIIITNLTWISDIWMYPDETILRLSYDGSGIRVPGLYTNSTSRDGVWKLASDTPLLLSDVDPQLPWLVGLTYRSQRAVDLTLTNGRPFQDMTLEPAAGWTRIAFRTNPHYGSSDIEFVFDDPIEVMDMWASLPVLRTNVGTAWDTNPHRHSPGACIGELWSAARSSGEPPYHTYRTGEWGSTIFLVPIDPAQNTLLTTEYRSEASVPLQLGSGRALGTLPPASQWEIHTIVVPPTGTDGEVLTILGEIDLSSISVELG